MRSGNQSLPELAMVEPIERSELLRLIEADAVQVVDVLPVGEYQQEHVPGAANIPLKSLNQETARVLDRTKPVAVY